MFLGGAKPSRHEKEPLVKPAFDPAIRLVERAEGFSLEITLDKAWGAEQTRKLVTTELLGRAKIPNLPFERADGTPIRIDSDYFGAKRNAANPFPGPFELPDGGQQRLRVWPLTAPQMK